MSSSQTQTAPKSEVRESKADISYERIRESILDGTYAPGARLVLDRIARDLGVSTLPVREAIRRLEAEGYVEFQQNVGATVAAVDAESYVQAIETLAVLEGAATSQAANQLTPEQLDRIRAFNDDMRTAFDQLDGRAYADAHDALHGVITEACENAHLVHVITDIRLRLRRVRMSVFGLGASGGTHEVNDHDELIRMVEAGAPAEEVEEFARAHIERSAAAFRGSDVS